MPFPFLTEHICRLFSRRSRSLKMSLSWSVQTQRLAPLRRRILPQSTHIRRSVPTLRYYRTNSDQQISEKTPSQIRTTTRSVHPFMLSIYTRWTWYTIGRGRARFCGDSLPSARQRSTRKDKTRRPRRNFHIPTSSRGCGRTTRMFMGVRSSTL